MRLSDDVRPFALTVLGILKAAQAREAEERTGVPRWVVDVLNAVQYEASYDVEALLIHAIADLCGVPPDSPPDWDFESMEEWGPWPDNCYCRDWIRDLLEKATPEEFLRELEAEDARLATGEVDGSPLTFWIKA